MNENDNNKKDIYYCRRGVNPPKETKLIMPSKDPIKMVKSHDGRWMFAKNQCRMKEASTPFQAGIRKKEYLKPEDVFEEKGPQLVKKK